MANMLREDDFRRKRVAVIGAGPAGLSVLHAFQSAASKGRAVPEVVCFERQEDMGGMWNYTWRVGTDELGEPVHSSMYRQLWSNGPKECLEFADYSFDEHLGKPTPSYPPREVVSAYVTGRAEKFGLRRFCRFRNAVRLVRFDAATSRLVLTAHDLLADRLYSEPFDHIVCASGHFSTPNVPSVPGLESFLGRVLHSHDFRDAREFAGKRVLLLGTSESAEDIGSQLWKYGAVSVTVSFRSRPMQFALPDSWTQRPLLVRVDGAECTFADGSSCTADAIIMATGYRHHFPFLEDGLRLRTENRLWPLGLYGGVVWESNPALHFLGMQDQYFTFSMFDAQAWFSRDLILGEIALPPAEAMAADSAQWREREEALDPHDHAPCVRFQAEHLLWLSRQTDCPRIDAHAVAELFEQWVRDKHSGFLTYRDRAHRSVVTGTMAAAKARPWLQELDDSAAAFLTQSGAHEPADEGGGEAAAHRERQATSDARSEGVVAAAQPAPA